MPDRSVTYSRPDREALAALEEAVRLAGEELAVWRRRSLRAETELQDLRARSGPQAGPDLGTARARVAELEQENALLRARLEAVRERVGALASRLAFAERGLQETS
ncbi:MAG: hypothetical protein MUC69_08905 [Gemmatimonadales bacterium]|nr:hypothetical protein [Gemmatimonadales bacterium]